MLEYILTTGIHILFKAPTNEPDRYRWVNTVLEDPKGMKDRAVTKLQAPYIDPPPGGFDYLVADDDIYYWDNNDCKICRTEYKAFYNRDGRKYQFIDYPRDYRLKVGQKIKFRTCVVDAYDNDKELQCVKWNWIKQRGIFGKTEIEK